MLEASTLLAAERASWRRDEAAIRAAAATEEARLQELLAVAEAQLATTAAFRERERAMEVDAAVLQDAVKQLQGELLEQASSVLGDCPTELQLDTAGMCCWSPTVSRTSMELRQVVCTRSESDRDAEHLRRASGNARQAGRYELRLLQQADRHAGEAAEMVAKAAAETEAALVERLDQRSKQVAEENCRLEGFLRMRSKVTHGRKQLYWFCVPILSPAICCIGYFAKAVEPCTNMLLLCDCVCSPTK